MMILDTCEHPGSVSVVLLLTLGQGDNEPRSLPQRTFDADFTAMTQHNLTTDRQP
jgi:hypothetical protein